MPSRLHCPDQRLWLCPVKLVCSFAYLKLPREKQELTVKNQDQPKRHREVSVVVWCHEGPGAGGLEGHGRQGSARGPMGGVGAGRGIPQYEARGDRVTVGEGLLSQGQFYQVFKEPKQTYSNKSTWRIKKTVFSNSFSEANIHTHQTRTGRKMRLNSPVGISVKIRCTWSHLTHYLKRRLMLDKLGLPQNTRGLNMRKKIIDKRQKEKNDKIFPKMHRNHLIKFIIHS